MPGNENDGGMAGLFTGPVDDDATWAAADLPCVHELVGFHAERDPDRVALTWDGGSLTYRALVEEAAGVAGRLGAVALGTPVGILLDGGPQVLVAMLGIMRAGGAYMPLSLDDPPARRERLLRDAGCQAVVTTRDLAVRLPSGVRPITPDEPAEPAGPAAVGADDLAYVLFTSGSTGRPKGVQVTHRSIVNLVLRDRELFEADGVHCMLAPLSFDGSTIEIWGALCAGGRLVVPDGRVVDPSEINRLVRGFGVTLIFLTRGLFNRVVEADTSGLGGLRHLTTGGDVMSPAHARLALERLPHAELVNVYGPTETTAFVTTCRMTRPQDVEDVIPIGHAVPGARLYVLDADRRESETGELYVGGLPLARGYLGAASSGSFMPDPFAASPEARMYRTGDRVRRRTDGALAFLGRVDDQVKVRGHRVEPSEVESTALGCDGVRQACCVARGDATGELTLALYVVADADTSAIRGHLHDRLPPYAEPAWIVALDDLPLTPLGKVDRAALPDPVRPVPAPAEVPATAAEQKIIEVWSRLLGVPGLGPDDDFFASGGHSLLAIRSATELRELIGAGVPYAVFMEHPTPRKLAAWIHGGRPATLDAPGGAIPRWDRRAPAPLSAPQEQIWILQHLYPESRAYHFQALLRFTGALSVPALEAALDRVIERHEVFRTSFGDVDGVPVQSVHPHEPFRLPVTDLAGLGDAERESGLADLTRRLLDAPFDLDRPPLARWRLARLGRSEHMLIHVEHHLIHDGWSFNQFLGELTEDYRQAVDGRVPPDDVEGELDYIDFAAWHREWLDNGERRRQLDHWLSRLDGCPPTSELPADRERPAVPSFAGASMRIPLPHDLSAGLRAFSRRHGVSLFTVLLSGFFVYIHRRTGQEDLCVGSALANRTRPETQRLIGMLVNSLPIRVRVDPSRSFADVLDATRQALAQAQDHQDLPVHEIVAATGAKRDVSRNPFFQLAFSSHDAPLASLRLPGAELSVTEGISNGSAKFDLGVIVIPRLEQGLGAAPGEHGSSITLLWEYATDLFDAATVEGIAAEYLALLRRLIPIPDTLLRELPGEEGPGSIEDLVAGIWAELLKRPHVEPEDDFFDLGGHSLLAIRTASRLERHLGFKVPAVDVLRHPTARGLAEHLSVRAGEPALSAKGRS